MTRLPLPSGTLHRHTQVVRPPDVCVRRPRGKGKCYQAKKVKSRHGRTLSAVGFSGADPTEHVSMTVWSIFSIIASRFHHSCL